MAAYISFQPSDHFNTTIWTGNSTDDRAITGVGFQPDMLWLKARILAYSHRLLDAIRGAPNVLTPSNYVKEIRFFAISYDCCC